MSDILQITTPALPKNYVNPNTTQAPQEQFQLADTAHVTSTQERTDQQTQDNADYSGENLLKPLELVIAENPTMTAESVKALLNEELMNALKASGTTSFLDELTSLANEILLNPDNIASDIAEQAKDSTMFTGKLFDILRNATLLSDSAFGGSEVKNSVTAFLKAYVNASSPQDVMKSLSSMFGFLSNEMFASRSISEELADLARKFADNNALQNFGELKEQAAEAMKNASGSLLMTDRLKGILSLVTYNLSRVQGSPDGLKDAFEKLFSSISDNPDMPQSMADELKKAFAEFVENSDLPDDVKSSALGKSFVNGGAVSAQTLADSVKGFSENIDKQSFLQNLSDINTDNGLMSLKELLSLVVPDKNAKDIDGMLHDFANKKDLNELASNLSKVINSIERDDVKLPLAQRLNEALENILNKGGVEYEKPTAMENFTNFLLKNLDDASLRNIPQFDRENLMSSLLTAPGVYTPLLHALVPLQVDDKRAYGELWADNSDDGENFHILLDFSVEDVGDFELEINAESRDLTVNLFCPEDFSKSFGNMRTAIARLAAGKGYSVRTSNVGVLREKRTLTKVFPNITEKRGGLNVTA
ncbi:MAG: hypothetical protein ACI4KD_06525 [Oscillospiraceae bacterium]